MTRTHWDKIANRYESEVFDVFKNDKKELITSRILDCGSSVKTASDIGCGIGNFIPSLSSCFKEVIAIDFSPKCVARAKEACKHLDNVSYFIRDLSRPSTRLPKVDFALSVNSIITPSQTRRKRILDVVCAHLRLGAYIVLVVPSLESAMFSSFRLIEWNMRDGIAPGAAAHVGFRSHKQVTAKKLHEGIVTIDGVETKHYLREELRVLLKTRRIQVVEVQKIEYPWKTEFTSPPRWMREPYPWDWLVVGQRTK
jgi:SAM-dependent methyltransferase